MYNLTLESSYPTPYAASQFLSLILLSMVSQKHTPDTTTSIKDAYDYIIVGAGSAGSIVASRLADEKEISILLLEAGRSPPKVTDIPAVGRAFIGSDLDWQYETAPQKYTGADLVDRRASWPSGKTVGGSGVINAMMNLRGNKKNYDDWANEDATGWDYNSVLRYFKKLETNANEEYIKNGYHGTDGPIVASNPPYDSELKKAVLEAAKNMGYYVGDIHGPKQTGFYDFQSTMKNGQRCSSAKAYLAPRDHLDNLHIVSEAFVKKVIIDNKQAVGVEFNFEGRTRKVKALKEVILSAGSINSAKLLMLSGIGPKEELDRHQIEVIEDLPVGQNLQDHFATILPFVLDDNIKSLYKKILNEDNVNSYIHNKTGPLASSIGVATTALLKRDGREAEDNDPEVQLYFWEGSATGVKTQMNVKPEFYKAYYEPYENKTIFFCLSQVLHPKGRGAVTLKSNDPYEPPIIDPMYFSNSDDLEIVAQGLKRCKEFGLSEPLKKLGSQLFQETYPGCEDFDADDDDYFRCIVRSFVMSINHPVGTAKMGNPRNPSTVVDPQLRVKGIQNLRVVDASIMPLIPGGNTNVPTMMIAEKGSDIILEDLQRHCEDHCHAK